MIAVLFGALLCFGLRAEEAASDSDKPTVVCFGDSITKRGYPAMLGESLGVKAINAGVAGHTSAEGLRRMKKDVIDKNPDVVVIFFGSSILLETAWSIVRWMPTTGAMAHVSPRSSTREKSAQGSSIPKP